MNIFEKLVEVRKAVEYLQKEANGPQFKYVSSSQVLGSLRTKMNELGLLLIPRVTGHFVRESMVEQFGKDDNIHPFKRTTTYFTELDMTMTWVNAEKPAETIECPWYGQGVDIAGEKGVGKALTYAEKYFLLKQFNIPTDKDDPDSFQEKHDPKPQALPNAKPTEKPLTKPLNGDAEFAKIVDSQPLTGVEKLKQLAGPLGIKTEPQFVVKINSWMAKAAGKLGFEAFEIKSLDDMGKVDPAVVSELIKTLEKTIQMGAK